MTQYKVECGIFDVRHDISKIIIIFRKKILKIIQLKINKKIKITVVNMETFKLTIFLLIFVVKIQTKTSRSSRSSSSSSGSSSSSLPDNYRETCSCDIPDSSGILKFKII